MKWQGHNGFALLLVGCGGLILLSKLGFGLGAFMGYLVPLALIGLGYLGIRRGRTIVGLGVMVLGGAVLLGKMSGLLGLIAAIAMIAYGFSSLKRSAA